MPVHLYGGAADMEPISTSRGATAGASSATRPRPSAREYKGRGVATLGDIDCFSSSRPRTSARMGEGGALTTADADLRGASRHCGSTARGALLPREVGINSRLDTLQAAVLRVKLRHLDEWTEARQANAGSTASCSARARRWSRCRVAAYQTRHVYNQFVVRSPHRDRAARLPESARRGQRDLLPAAAAPQVCFRRSGLSNEGDFPVSEQAAREVLALPVYPGLAPDDIEYVAGLLQEFRG